ncbi:MAG: dihydrolipoyl dehydrogenase [Candidatus Omnitrophota bacterium]
MDKKYDYIVIGSGPAGHISAITAAKLGLRAAIIEKDLGMMGGVCLNEGCIPAKSLYASAHLFGAVKDLAGTIGTWPHPNEALSEMIVKSTVASETLKRGLLSHLRKLGVDILEASAEFEDRSRLTITAPQGKKTRVGAEKILIATGSVPRSLDTIPFDGQSVISSSQAIKLSTVPENILIIGAGAIGVEFASFFSTMGSSVTLVESETEILHAEDRDVSASMRNMLKKMGVKVFTSAAVGPVTGKRGKVFAITSQKADGTVEGEYDIVLVSVGRIPSTSDLKIARTGIIPDDKGYIPVNGEMQTNIKGLYAAGDVVPGPMLAHVAQAEGELAAFSAAGRAAKPLDYSSIPNAVYSCVQAASVGFTEKQAAEAGRDVIAGKSFFKANGKAVAVGEYDGFVKIIADAKTHIILGAHIVGHLATEIINEFAIARRLALTVDDIAGTVHAHPTFSESASSAAKDIIFKKL